MRRATIGSVSDPIVARLQASGCVFAEDEAAFIRRHLRDTDEVERAVSAREAGMPLEQAVGVVEFAGVVVEVRDGVFVPRARAEAIVETAAALRPVARVVVDLGCGCGALAAALASRLEAQVHAADLDPGAVAVARANGARHGFTVHEGSWWDALPDDLRGRVDLAVAYLPHVPSDVVKDIHADFRAHEPRTTVDGGPDGLDHLRHVLASLDAWLAPGGAFVTLLSAGQADGLPGRVVPVDEDDVALVVELPA